MFLLSWLLLVLGVSGQENSTNRAAKKGRLFNIFQITNFPQSACTSDQGSGDVGTCLTPTECQKQGGQVSGSCASGFGSCCLLYLDTCGGTVTQNRTYIRNPGYPGTYTTAGTCTWIFQKCQENICQIRLDFTANSLAAPESVANSGQCSTDRGYANPVTGPNTPDHCGENLNQHMYFDAGAYSSDSAQLVYELTGTTTARKWKILVTMIECSSPLLPPAGCYQYHTAVTGQVRSFNFDVDSISSYEHLRNQFYNVCVRRNKKYCKIGWSQSTDSNSFKISRPAGTDSTDVSTFSGRIGSLCRADSVTIPGGSNGGGGVCSLTNSGTAPTLQSVDRYCGGSLNCYDLAMSPAEIVSSVTPFLLGVHFNQGEPDTSNNRGFCLNYRQITC